MRHFNFMKCFHAHLLFCSDLAGSLFQPLIFLLFNLGDAVGRALPGFHRDIYSPGPLFSYAGLRILLVIGIMLCNIVPHHSWAFSHILW